MEMIPVSSSNIAAIGYDSERAELRIEFTTGSLYEYYEVPQYVFDEFLAAESKGGYANEKIYKEYNQQRIG